MQVSKTISTILTGFLYECMFEVDKVNTTQVMNTSNSSTSVLVLPELSSVPELEISDGISPENHSLRIHYTKAKKFWLFFCI